MSGAKQPENTGPGLDSDEQVPTLPRSERSAPPSGEDARPGTGDSEPSEAMLAVPLPGQLVLDRYTVLGQLGQGGMGVVLSVYDARLDRRVALKLLRPRDVAGGSTHDEQGRFLREAQAMARLNHPNVVAVYDAGTLETGSLFIAMELVEGQTLRRWQRLQRPWRQVLEMYLAAGRGLAAAHAAGLIHRDFKPDNVLVGQDGRARVTDFGLARLNSSLLAGDDEEPSLASPPLPSQALEAPITEPGSRMGTPRYMAPEQLKGQRADARSDVYAFCVSLYEALYDEPPFRGNTVAALRRAHREGKVTPPKDVQVPAWLERTLLQGLAIDPAQRPASVTELLTALADDPEAKRRARLRRTAFTGVTLALAVLAIWGWARQQVRGCDRLGMRLEGVWDKTVQAKVEQALLATGLPYAQATAERVTAALDKYAGAWVIQRTELCLSAGQEGSTQGRGLLALEESCLERRRSQLRALTELLSQGPDPALVGKAVPAVLALPPLAYCADAKALTATVPPPEDPAVRAKVEALQEQVDRLEAAFNAGKYKDGLAQADALLPQVEPVGYAPLLARALFAGARLREGMGDFPGAEQRLRQSMAEAARGKDLAQLARGWSSLVMVVGYRQGRHEEGLLLHSAAANLAEVADDDRIRASELNNYGTVLSELGRFEEARQMWERALALREKTGGPENLDAASVLNNLALVCFNTGQYEEARQRHLRALALREKLLGSEHPMVAGSLNNLGLVLWKMSRHEEAYQVQSRALALREKILSPDHPDVAASLLNLGLVLSEMGRYEEARDVHTRVLAMWEKTLGPEHPDVALALNNLGVALEALGKYEESRKVHERALALREKVLGPTHFEVANTHGNLGSTLRHMGKYAEAREHFTRSLELLEKAVGPTHPDLVWPLLGLSHLLLEQKKPAEALPLVDRALKLGPENMRAEGQFVRAKALWDLQRDREQAVVLATQARDEWQRLGRKKDVEEASQWLATHDASQAPPRKSGSRPTRSKQGSKR